MNADVVWVDRACFPQDQFYVWPRDRRGVCRLADIRPTMGELYYLRRLLLRFPGYSYEELRAVGDTVHVSFHDAAVARGIIENGQEARSAMTDTCNHVTSTPHDLRATFCMLLQQSGDACDPRALFDEFWERMAADIRRPGHASDPFNVANAPAMSDTLRMLLLVRRLNGILGARNESTQNYHLPSAVDLEIKLTDAERRLLEPEPSFVDEFRGLRTVQQARDFFDAAVSPDSAKPLTDQQRDIIDFWIAERTAGRVPQFIIEALSGRGKTYV